MATALGMTMAGARAWDDSKYPDLKGQWVRVGPAGFNGTRFDPSKPPGRGQEAPLTAEYQAIFEDNLADQALGGQGTTPTYACLSPGMPRATNGYNQIEFVVTQATTYVLVQHINDDRRIFTDGRDWPAKAEPTFMGYSIGKWIDTKGDGRFDTLEVETRNFKGPRTVEFSGIPLAEDNETVVKERISLDKANPDRLLNEITTIDNALTQPWTVLKTYRRERNPIWFDYNCPEGNHHVRIGKENYYVSEDGALWPSKKGQPPPQLKYFDQKRE